jgi:hypothetical protein
MASQLTNNLSAKDSYSLAAVPWKTNWKQLIFTSLATVSVDIQNYLISLEAAHPNFLLVSWQLDIPSRLVLFQFIDQTDFLP